MKDSRKKVVVRATIEYVVDYPDDWDKDNIEFHRNEGTWCVDNMIGELEELSEHHPLGCMCEQVKFEYLRDATPEDMSLLMAIPEDQRDTD